MKFLRWVILLPVLLAACSGGNTPASTAGPKPTQTSVLPTPVVDITDTPNAQDAAAAFLTGWKDGNYDAMYGFLSGASKDALSKEDFTKRYQDFAKNLTLAVAVGLVMLWNFFINRYWTYNDIDDSD